MGFHRVRSHAVILALGILAGCKGQIVSGSSGTGGSVGTGTGGTGGTGDTGAGGSTGSGGDGTASVLNLKGSPQYFRFVRLSNAQWGRAVQDVLKLDAPVGPRAELPGRGHRHDRLLEQRAGAGRQPAIVGQTSRPPPRRWPRR